MEEQKLTVHCLNVNCPERQGGKCWFDVPLSMVDKIMIDKEIKNFLKNPDYELSEEFEKLFDRNKEIIYGEA